MKIHIADKRQKHCTALFWCALLIPLFFSMSIGAGIGTAKEISGYIRTSSGRGIQDVRVTFDNIGSTTTKQNGYYSKGIPKGWSGTVTPTKNGYTFEPASRSYNNLESNLSGQNFTGSATAPPNIAVSGHVRTSQGVGIKDVVLTFGNGGGTARTDSSGYYDHSLDSGWSGTVTPTKSGHSFMPRKRTYRNVFTDQTRQDYTGGATISSFVISLDVVGNGTAQLSPNQDAYAHGSLISVTALADKGWTFEQWQGDLKSANHAENLVVVSDLVITAVFLEDSDDDGVSDEEENANPSEGDGNKDGILDSLQNNVISTLMQGANTYVTFETPVGVTISGLENVVDPSQHYPQNVWFPYGLFAFELKGINSGNAASISLYFPPDHRFSTYFKYGPTPEVHFDKWYEFIYDNDVGAEWDDSMVTLHFIDGERGDDDLIKNGIIVDKGGPAYRTATSPESSAPQAAGDTDRYGCFTDSLVTSFHGEPLRDVIVKHPPASWLPVP